MDQRDCLKAALTLLVKSGVLKEDDVLNAISGGGHDGIFELLNEKYKEVMSTQ